MTETTTRLWTKDPVELLRRPLDFFPRPGQNPIERANSLARLCIYASLIVGAYRNRLIPYAAGGLVAAVVVTYLIAGRGSDRYDDTSESGYVDNTGPARGPGEGQCTRPSAENPYANALVSDFGNPDFHPACSLATPGVAEDQKKFFEKGLVRSVYDPWGRQNNARTWYTLPSPTGVADTEAVRNFLYGTHLNCKDNMKDCSTRPMCKENENGGGAMCTGFFHSK
jgi:hypothetical protein